MFVVGRMLDVLAFVADIALTAYMCFLIARVLMSWVQPDPDNPIVQFLNRATEPVLAPIRRHVSRRLDMDVAPLIAILLMVFLQVAVAESLMELAQHAYH